MRLKSSGFSTVWVVIALLILTPLAVSGYVWYKKHSPPGKQAPTTNTKAPATKQPSDPSEGGKYLVVKEWNVRVLLPDDLRGKVAYALGEPVTDPDNNQIQAAKMLLKDDPAVGNQCAVTTVQGEPFIEAGAQLLQVQKDKPFDTARYRGTFKADIFADDQHIYHLNYVTPDCAESTTANQIIELQGALTHTQSAS